MAITNDRNKGGEKLKEGEEVPKAVDSKERRGKKMVGLNKC